MKTLRELAEKAMRGPWSSQSFDDDPSGALVYGPDGDSFATLTYNPGNDEDPVATAAYIAAASPDVVLRLLAIEEAARAYILFQQDIDPSSHENCQPDDPCPVAALRTALEGVPA